jgi:hypothetical protein
VSLTAAESALPSLADDDDDDATVEAAAAKADTDIVAKDGCGEVAKNSNNNTGNNMMVVKVQSIDFKIQEAVVAAQNAACKRKHQSKMLKGKNQQARQRQELGIVRPNDVLAVVKFQHRNNNNSTKETDATSTSTSSIPLSCCVWGTILERNHVNLEKNPALLLQDPLLDGYLAVVLPTGPFPPPSSSSFR